MNCTSHSPRLAMLPGTLRHPRRCVSRTRHSPGMNQQTLSAFIWSVADLVAKEKLGINPEPFLLRKSGHSFYNASPLDLKTLLGDSVEADCIRWRCPRVRTGGRSSTPMKKGLPHMEQSFFSSYLRLSSKRKSRFLPNSNQWRIR